MACDKETVPVEFRLNNASKITIESTCVHIDRGVGCCCCCKAASAASCPTESQWMHGIITSGAVRRPIGPDGTDSHHDDDDGGGGGGGRVARRWTFTLPPRSTNGVRNTAASASAAAGARLCT